MMKIDMHIHTKLYSPCSNINPSELCEKALERQLDGIVITEHNVMWSEKERDKFVSKAKDLAIFFGVEINVDSGEHYLVFFNYHEGYPDIYATMDEDMLFHVVHNAGGIVIAAHPFRYNKRFNEKFFKPYPIDALEVYSTNIDHKGSEKAIALSKKRALCSVAGSDAHSLNSVGKYYTKFEKTIKNETDLIMAVKEKRCYPVVNAR